MTISGHMLRMAAAAANNSVPTDLVPGDEYGGGYFYAYMLYPDGFVYAMILAPKSAETQAAWATVTRNDVGAVSLIDGWGNCAALSGNDYPAVRHCRSYAGGGHNDWYLGAKYEFEPVYRVFKPTTTNNSTSSGENPYAIPPTGAYTANDPTQTLVPGFAQGEAQALEVASYWCSNQASETNADRKPMANGSDGSVAKTTTIIWARPIRKVRVS